MFVTVTPTVRFAVWPPASETTTTHVPAPVGTTVYCPFEPPTAAIVAMPEHCVGDTVNGADGVPSVIETVCSRLAPVPRNESEDGAMMIGSGVGVGVGDGGRGRRLGRARQSALPSGLARAKQSVVATGAVVAVGATVSAGVELPPPPQAATLSSKARIPIRK